MREGDIRVRIRIKPKWNVKLDGSDRAKSLWEIRIKPKWNVKILTTFAEEGPEALE